MTLIRRVLKEFNCNIHPKHIKGHGENTASHAEKPVAEPGAMDSLIIWPEDFLPYTKYMCDQTEGNLDKIEYLWNKPLDMKSKRLVQILTQIDLDLIRAISADDLINYDGNESSRAISHIQNITKALMVIFSTDFNAKTLFKMLKHALLYKNYNLIYILIKSLQGKKISQRKLSKIAFYNDLMEKERDGIFPLAWMLKDCEDSNLNVESEVASLRFCKIIEKLKEMKAIEHDFRVEDKHRQMVYSKAWDTTRRTLNITEAPKRIYDYLYLIV